MALVVVVQAPAPGPGCPPTAPTPGRTSKPDIDLRAPIGGSATLICRPFQVTRCQLNDGRRRPALVSSAPPASFPRRAARTLAPAPTPLAASGGSSTWICPSLRAWAVYRSHGGTGFLLVAHGEPGGRSVDPLRPCSCPSRPAASLRGNGVAACDRVALCPELECGDLSVVAERKNFPAPGSFDPTGGSPADLRGQGGLPTWRVSIVV